MKLSKDPNTTLVTYALGSCIGLTVWDPVAKVGGMQHYMRPDSKRSPEKASANPFMFGGTGVPRLFRQLYEHGANKRRVQIKAAGGSDLLDVNGTFNIGKRNYLLLGKMFWKNNVILDAEDIGGTRPRTLRLRVGTGQVTVSSKSSKETEL